MDKPPQAQDPLAKAHTRIAELEAELAAHKAPPNPRLGDLAEAEAWLRQVISELFNHDNPEAPQKALAALGEFLQLDDCLLARIGEDQLHWELIWQRNPNDSEQQVFSKFKLEHMPTAHGQMLQGKIGIDSNLAASGYSTPETQTMSELLDIRAYLMVPVQHHGQLHSFLALTQRGHPRRWSDTDIHVAETFSAVLSLALSRQESLQALSISQQRFLDAMAATRDGIWEWDLQSHQFYMSDGFYRMLGYQPDELKTDLTHVTQLLHPDERHLFSRFTEVAQRADLDSAPLGAREIRFLHRDGHIIWCFVRAKFTHFNIAGRPTRMVGVNADISKFKAVQEELTIAKTLADSASQSKTEFLTRMSHEIRTPMNAIIGMGHLLKDTHLSRQQGEFLANIDHAANALLNLINEILDFSKIESGSIVLEQNHFDLFQCLNKLSQRYSPTAEQKGLEIFFHIDPDVPQFIKGDTFRLQQALGNLIDNAIKFTPSGNIYVDVKPLVDCQEYVELQFSVKDTGIGMNADQLSELFTPFMQIDGSSRRRFGGSGLGLTVSKHLIELMHGSLHVQSRPEQGTEATFNVRFSPSQIGAEPLRTRNRNIRPLRTLVVDDNKAARQILANLALHLELTVSAVGSAREAYQVLKSADSDPDHYIELVLMDYKMPEEDGLSASNNIKHHCGLKHVPAIILVSAFQKGDVLREGDENIEHFITKPVSQSHLFDAIAEVFGETAYRTEKISLSDGALANKLKGAHVLLAEDNVVNQKVAVGILKKMNVTVSLANNGQEAIDILYAHPMDTFACILMDMEMPEVDGYDATRRIRAGAHCQSIPIIALTAHAMRGDRKRCLDSGMNAYLTKPIKPALLYQTIAGVITSDQPQTP
ncbi:hybrid sensor histidine kinase/response regulator [Simiduia aestuariiviva]|uniref:Sensory/regulatory protein RpfC n=1 Tax=Simiduia aestuariiviva TaxID=1510459 RepID=A0A839UWF3_9GAMM|nr:response regulator [Simiduia aestuariiviva]MBB3169687.1 PAS domain S-box-containing protein [Simiduia aestuariiviva]